MVAEAATPLQAARTEAARLFQAEQKLEAGRIDALAQLAEAERATGAALVAAMLDGGEQVEGPEPRSESVKSSARAIDFAIAESRRRRGEAIVAAHRAEAAELREQAAGLQAEIAERQPKVRKLLGEIERLEGWSLGWQPWSRKTGVPSPWGPDEGPISSRQARQAADLEARAQAAEAQPHDRGAVTGKGAPDLLAALAAQPLLVGPRLPDALAWAERVLAEEAKRNREPITSVSLMLVWSGGAIDERRSECHCQHEHPATVGSRPGWLG